MYYVGQLVKKKKLFQRSFAVNGNNILITDTRRSKKKFLKKGIKNVVFTDEIREDETFAPVLRQMYAYDKTFIEEFLERMIVHMVRFLKMEMPLEEICIFSSRHEAVASKFAKMVTVVGEGEDKTVDGISVRYVKKIRSLPALAIVNSNEQASLLWGVPCINLSEYAEKAKNATTWETMSFKCSLFTFEISAASIIYLIKTGAEFDYELTSLRKKSPTLLSFC